jgi:hypothetical protein
MLAHVWAGTLIGGVFYFTAHAFNVVDIRFLPFAQLGACLAAGAALGWLLAQLPAPRSGRSSARSRSSRSSSRT